MWRFWDTVVEPLLDAVRPRRILEIGVDSGLTTSRLLAYAAERGAVVEAIDPRPPDEIEAWIARYPEALRFHRGLSVDVLPGLAPADIALVDGDHNWYTVQRELQLLESTAAGTPDTAPVVVLHDIGWPYGRRDLYYDADTVPEAHRHPHVVGGLPLDGGAVTPAEGFNAHLDHAIHEGGDRNGVLTGIEDFLAASTGDWRLTTVPGLNGLGILALQRTLTENGRLRDFMEATGEGPFLRSVIEAVESARLDSEIRRQQVAHRLAQANAARAKLQSDLAEADGPATIHAIREELADLARARKDEQRQRARTEKREQRLKIELAAARTAASHSDELRDQVERQRDELQREVAELARIAEAAQRAAADAEHGRAGLADDLARREQELDDLATAHAKLTADIEVAREIAQAQRERLETESLRSEGYELQLGLLRQALTNARTDAEIAGARREASEHGLEVPIASESEGDGIASKSEGDGIASKSEGDGRQAHAVTSAVAGSALPEPELEARTSFLTAYAGRLPAPGATTGADVAALPTAHDRYGALVAEHPREADVPTLDIVVCVHDALDDVRSCLWSVLDKTDRPYRLIVVDDGSKAPTRTYLRSLTEAIPAITLIEREPPHGYTLAANAGLRAATGDYVVLLNSDTIVTPGWLDRIVECGESSTELGILGPLSNAASHQSIPELRSDGEWATNPIPPWASPDAIAKLLERLSPRARPRLPFINGFCYVIKRAVIDAIGYFDEERFASGYCEENDYSIRAADAGFELAVVDDAYVFHQKSRSFSAAGRKILAKRNYEVFLDKHGRERVADLVGAVEADTSLSLLRASVGERLSSGADLASGLDLALHDPIRIVFVLPGLGRGGSGGSHSVYQEVRGLRRLGLDARIAVEAKSLPRARAAYDDADEVFHPFADVDELADVTSHADVISATHYKSVALVAGLRSRRDDFLPAYYVQDYEPFFTAEGSLDYAEAFASYSLIENCLLFAKTHWLCNIVAERHGVHVAKVEPSIDERLFRPADARPARGPLRIAAMVRPRTPRRQPTATIAVLEEVAARLGDGVAIRTFGCPKAELLRFTSAATIVDRHRGVLHRRDVAELLAATDVFVDMSTYQAFGRTSLEAMACGATSIVPRIGGVWEFVEQRRNAIAVDTFDPREAIDAVVELAEDRGLLGELQAHARRTGARYSIPKASLSEYLVLSREHGRRFGATPRRRHGLPAHGG